MRNIKEINNKNRKYYFFNDIIKINNFNLNLLKIDKNSCKNIDIYYIGYIAIKVIVDYESIHSVNPLYLIIDETNGCIKKKNRNKYLVFASTDKNIKVLKKYKKHWNEIKNLIKTIDNEPGEYGKDFMMIICL